MKSIFYLFICFTFASIHSQTVEKIKFQKNSSFIYFFPKTVIKDSVINNSNNLFYLLVHDSLKKTIIISVENGQLIKTANDSLVKLNYMSGLKYESHFVVSEQQKLSSKKPKNKIEIASLINGASAYPKNKISIQIINKKEEKIIIENVFYYRE